MKRTALVCVLALPLLWWALPAPAETVSTLTLDGLSFVSFQDEEVLALPAGSTIRFRFGTPDSNGTVPFTIEPAGVEIGAIDLAAGQSLRYGLAGPAAGSLRSVEGGRIIAFDAAVRATLVDPSVGHQGTYTYSMPFTTETVTATNLLGSIQIEVTGLRLEDGVWYAQIVGATVNRANAFPKPGAAVYTVLSGSFDQLP